ncbi:MAG: DUF3784 domain-containing protein [Halovenus sp.]
MFTPFDSPETTVLGGTLVVLGYLLAVHGWTFLVAGYGDDSDVPEEVVADQIGRFSLVAGVATIGFGAVTTSDGYGFGWQGIVFGATVLLATVGLTYRLNTYEEPKSSTPAPADQVPDRSPEQVTIQPPTGSQSAQSIQERAVEFSTTPATSPARTPDKRATESAIEDPSQAEQQPVEITN